MTQDNQSKITNNEKVEVKIQPITFQGDQLFRPPAMFNQNAVPLKDPEVINGSLEYSYPVVNNSVSIPSEINKLHYEEKTGEAPLKEGMKITYSSDTADKTKTLQNNKGTHLNFHTSSNIPLQHEISRPPPQVMTALGPMPLPPEIRKKIPEKFVAKSIYEEREIYLARKHLQQRTIEIPHVQYEHKFCEVPKAFSVDRLVPSLKEVVKEIPREIYKPCIEEKVIEVPQGVKYVEVPLEVPCAYPPKIVPKPTVQYVERVIETIKPIVKEEIIEVPQTIVKHIPKIKIVEVPYFVPRYCEKIIEVPYKPSPEGNLPMTNVGDLPMPFLPALSPKFPMNSQIHGNFPANPFTIGPLPLSEVNEIKLPFEAKIEVKVTQPEFAEPFSNDSHDTTIPFMQKDDSLQFNDTEVQPNILNNSYESNYSGASMGREAAPQGLPMGIFPHNLPLISGQQMVPGNVYNRMKLPGGYKWGAPPNLPPNSNPFLQTLCSPCLPYPLKEPLLPPMVITSPPEIGKVSLSSHLTDPDILTRAGVLPYEGFKTTENPLMLFPPLPPHPSVPMAPYPAAPGTPDIKTIDNILGQHSTYLRPQKPQTEIYNQELQGKQDKFYDLRHCLFNSACCASEKSKDAPQSDIVNDFDEIKFRAVSNEPQ